MTQNSMELGTLVLRRRKRFSLMAWASQQFVACVAVRMLADQGDICSICLVPDNYYSAPPLALLQLRGVQVGVVRTVVVMWGVVGCQFSATCTNLLT